MNGLILIDKPQGVTSFVAVAVIRRAAGEKHCGHTGTLDPMATGLLPVLVGRATKLSSYLLEGDKAYRAEMAFGAATDTLDATGTVTERGGRIPDLADIEAVLPLFIGKIKQTPPMYSAIKKDGVAMYKLARKGLSVDLPAREIEIYQIDLLSYRDGVLSLDVRCSKGTYIRSLCRDLAGALGTLGHMTALRRTGTTGFSLENALPLYEAEERLKAGDTSFVLPPDRAVPFGRYAPPAFFAELLSNGCAVEVKKLPGCPEGPVWVEKDGAPVGIGRVRDGRLKIETHI